MEVKEIIKEFTKNKLKDLEKCINTLKVGEPSCDADIQNIILENYKIMRNSSNFLYYYMLLELNIINHKKYSKEYDYETVEEIEENLLENYNQYLSAKEKILND